MERDLTTGRILPRVLSFSFPLALAMAFHAAFNLVDLAIVGRLGEEALAGVGLGSTINFFPIILGNGISVSSVALVSQAIGAGRREEGAKIANLAFLLMLSFGILLGILGWIYAETCILALEARGESLDLGTRYLQIMSLGTFSMFLLMHTTGLLRSLGNAFWPTMLLVGSNVLNLVLDILLIFGWEPLGIPKMGVEGAAWATILARLAGGILGLALLARKTSPLPPGFRLPSRPLSVLHQIHHLGIFQSVQMVMRAGIVLTANHMAGKLGGQPAHGALSIAIRLDTFVFFAGVGWASGATAMVGQSIAKGARDRCRRIALITALVAGLLSIPVGLCFRIFTAELFGLFSEDPSQNLIGFGKDYFLVLAWSYPAATASLVLAGAINGTGRSLGPMLLDFLFFGLLLQTGLWLWSYWGNPGGLRACWLLILLTNWLLLCAYFLAFGPRSWRDRPEKLTVPGEGPCQDDTKGPGRGEG